MIKLLFSVPVGLLLVVLVVNLVAFMMPVLTHPVVTIILLGFFVLIATAVYKASQK